MALPEELAAYLSVQQRARHEAVRRVTDNLTDREKQLVQEAAVMGYVQGRMLAPRSTEPFPGDAAIVAMVIDACVLMHDPTRGHFVAIGEMAEETRP